MNKTSRQHKTGYLRTLMAGALFLFACNLTQAAEWDMAKLMGALAQAKPTTVHFVEKKYIAALTQPIISSGEMLYTPPDKLERRTLKPKPERMLLENDRLLLERGGKSYSLSLNDIPELATLIISIRATLAGDRRLLELNYIVALTGTRERWALQLKPSDIDVQQKVERIMLSGSNDQVQKIEVWQADGDRSVTTIQKLAP
tara:strand:+ start:909052 stop:909654 length:603 start_codon:yes stop_codon:yes gene_type:complete